MFAKHTLFLLVVSIVEARFGQEQGNGAVQAINALGDIGQPGQAATLAGGSIQFLLAAANPCQKLIHADKIVETLGTDDRVIAAARGFVEAEQNFNPFNVKIPNVCAEADLPKTEALRGVLPLIDPDVGSQDIENANAKASLEKPFDATGKSVAEVMVANGFTNFTAVKLDGTKVDLTGAAGGAATGGGAGGGNKDNKNAAGEKKEEGGNATGAGDGQKNEAGAGAGGAGGGNKDNKNADGEKKEEGGNATGAEDQGKKEKEEKPKAAGDEKKQNKIKACSALISSLDKGKAAGANEKAEGKNEEDKKAGGANDNKAAGVNEKAGGKDEDEKKGAGAAKTVAEDDD